ncbi:MAG: N-acetylmuramoyl-L-alanine amidase [Actinobacteria bacterium]|nr:N-acetylmuramoyl-L-alanine amidase [Actinomycetota bacterium]
MIHIFIRKTISLFILLSVFVSVLFISGLANAQEGQPIIITVDPGHGGGDPGATGPSGLTEKEVNLDIALQLKGLLEANGYAVVMTRADDSNPSLESRVAVANSSGATLFVSVHNNAFTNPEANGTETWYTPSQSALSGALAKSVLGGVVDAIGLRRRGVKEGNLYVTKNTIMPSVLVESAFITNPNEENLLKDAGFRGLIAAGIFNGIINFLSSADLSAITNAPTQSQPLPDIAFNNIADGAVVPRKYTVLVDTTPEIKRVAFYLDGKLEKLDKKGPFKDKIKFGKGEHILTIVGMDKKNNWLVQKEIKVIRQ